jgi:TonB family protein
MRAICLHEIGHALGLVNHSLDPHDVMFPYLTQQKSLSIRDTNTIHMLYDFQPPLAVLLLPREPQLDRVPPLDPNYPFGMIALSSDKYEAYTRQVVEQLRKHFTAFSVGPMLECNIRCFVDSTGNIFNYKIFQGSSNDSFDQKAMATLVSALPLPPPPVKLRGNRWSKTPIAFKFRSDGWIVPYVEPDPNQSDWLKTSEQPSADVLMKDLQKDTTATPKVIDPNLEPWIVAITQKAHDAWKVEGTGKAEVIAGIGSAGRITHLVITKPSGDASFDNSVLNACMAAEPYPSPPSATQGTTEVNMLFEH